MASDYVRRDLLYVNGRTAISEEIEKGLREIVLNYKRIPCHTVGLSPKETPMLVLRGAGGIEDKVYGVKGIKRFVYECKKFVASLDVEEPSYRMGEAYMVMNAG